MQCSKIINSAFPKASMVIIFAALALLAQNPQRNVHAAPVQVAGFHGRFCSSMGPRGWAVIAENPQRVAFGADSLSNDGKAAASYSIFASGALNPVPGFENPDRAVATSLSGMGTQRIRFGQRRQLDRNVFEVSYQTGQNEGVAFYQVFPDGRGTNMVLMRSAYTGIGGWKTRGAEASAVARSMHCNVPNMPPSPDPPVLNHKSKPKPGAEEGESDSLYNVWLDKEYYHNPRTGENFWVSPSSDFDQNGPQGPGYYARHGNEIIKLDSGYSQ